MSRASKLLNVNVVFVRLGLFSVRTTREMKAARRQFFVKVGILY